MGKVASLEQASSSRGHLGVPTDPVVDCLGGEAPPPARAHSRLTAGLTVVVPVFNSELLLAALVERLLPVLQNCAERYELILVNDDSHDRSWRVVTDLAAKHSWVRGIDLMRNFGQHNALLCGIREARYDRVVTMDDDLQHPPEEIPNLLAKLTEGYDVVYGRPEHEQHGLWRNIASRMTKLALRHSMDIEVAGVVGAFRAFHTQVRDAFADFQSPILSLDVLLTWGTTRFAAIPVRHDKRSVGKSNYSFSKLLTHALNMMTGFSTWPLQLASWLGFGVTVFGILVFAYVIGVFVARHGAVPGFTFLASIIAIFSGAQLFALGIIGEYLARMHARSMERPIYVVRNTTTHDGEAAQ
jgi:glycosyltransferase involved in cell wall biosynthesis